MTMRRPAGGREVGLVIAFAMLTGIAFRGSKVLVALHALALGANPLVVGVLAAGYSICPLFLAVHAGRVSDRVGVRLPLAVGSLGIGAGLAVPILFPSLAGLLACVTVLGVAHIYYQVAVQYAVGSFGSPGAAERNFANFSLGASVAAFVGPAATGFLIDAAGYSATAAVLACIAVIPALTIGFARRLVPAHAPLARTDATKGTLNLWTHPPLRRALVMSGVVLTGLDLFTFYMPIYGRAVGASASAIGLVLASYAAAAFLVRIAMPRLSKRMGGELALSSAFLVGATAYLLFPMVNGIPVLMAIAFVLGLGLGLGQPLTVTMVYQRAPPGRSGEALGMRLTVNKVMQVAIPLAFGTLGTAFGVYPVFWANALFLAIAGVLGIRRAERPPRAATTPLPPPPLDSSPRGQAPRSDAGGQ